MHAFSGSPHDAVSICLVVSLDHIKPAYIDLPSFTSRDNELITDHNNTTPVDTKPQPAQVGTSIGRSVSHDASPSLEGE